MRPAPKAAATRSTRRSSPHPRRAIPPCSPGSRRSRAAFSKRREAMKVAGKPMRTIWLEADGSTVGIIDQTRLPHALVTARLETLDDVAQAIRTMQVRGAPLTGAAYGVALAMRADARDAALEAACRTLLATRPTAVNLRWALEEMRRLLAPLPPPERAAAAFARAAAIC